MRSEQMHPHRAAARTLFFRLSLALGVVLGCMLPPQSAIATEVRPMSVEKVVKGADAIVVGTIVSHQSRWGDTSQRWMQTDYQLAVEDVVYPSEQGPAIGE